MANKLDGSLCECVYRAAARSVMITELMRVSEFISVRHRRRSNVRSACSHVAPQQVWFVYFILLLQQGRIHGVSRVSGHAPFNTVPFFEKEIFSKRSSIRRILGFWRSKVPQNGNHRPKFNAASFIPGGEIRNRTK